MVRGSHGMGGKLYHLIYAVSDRKMEPGSFDLRKMKKQEYLRAVFRKDASEYSCFLFLNYEFPYRGFPYYEFLYYEFPLPFCRGNASCTLNKSPSM